MALRAVLTQPHPALRKISEPLLLPEIHSDVLVTLIQDLIETLAVENGVGIAAPQIGSNRRLIVVDVGDGPIPLINPVLTTHSFRMMDSEEGCLSIPGVTGIVKRYRRVTVEAYDTDGQRVTIKAGGLFAIVLQHEMDHLDGILFIDKVVRFTSPQLL